MKSMQRVVVLAGFILVGAAFAEEAPVAAEPRKGQVTNPWIIALPTDCDELLPENEAYTEFLRSASRILAIKNGGAAVKALKILSYRDELQMELNWTDLTSNVGDAIIRAYVCHHFTAETRLNINTTSPQLVEFLNKNSLEIIDRLKREINDLRSERAAAAKLLREVQDMDREFTLLRRDVAAEVRAELVRQESSRPSTRTRKKPSSAPRSPQNPAAPGATTP